MPDNVQTVVEQIEQQPTAEQPAPVTPSVDADPDDAEVLAARAALDAETKPQAQTETPAQPTPATPPQPQPAAAAPQAQPEPSPVMIPKARLDEALAKSSEKDTHIARLQGENEALKLMRPQNPGAQPGAQPQPQAKSADDQLKDIRTERLALSKKFDNGEIGLTEYEEANFALKDREDQLREARLAEKFKPAPAQPQAPATDLRLEERYDELGAKHLYVNSPEVLEPDHWEFLLVEAAKQLRSEGVVLAEGPLPAKQRLQLAERVATLSDTYGPLWGAKPATPQAQPKVEPQPPAPAPKAAPTAQQRENKLALAANAPPDVNRLTPQGGTAEFTEDMIANMSDEEILALPKSVRERFAPTTS